MWSGWFAGATGQHECVITACAIKGYIAKTGKGIFGSFPTSVALVAVAAQSIPVSSAPLQCAMTMLELAMPLLVGFTGVSTCSSQHPQCRTHQAATVTTVRLRNPILKEGCTVTSPGAQLMSSETYGCDPRDGLSSDEFKPCTAFAAPEPGKVGRLMTIGQLQAAVNAAGNEQLVVVKFMKGDCVPCELTVGLFRELASAYGSQGQFYTCDLDEAQQLCRLSNIKVVPTAHVFSKGKLRGALPMGSLTWSPFVFRLNHMRSELEAPKGRAAPVVRSSHSSQSPKPKFIVNLKGLKDQTGGGAVVSRSTVCEGGHCTVETTAVTRNLKCR